MKVAVFKYEASHLNSLANGGGECINAELIEREINAFCEDEDVIDIKVNTVEAVYHNNAGANGVYLVYTIIYK